MRFRIKFGMTYLQHPHIIYRFNNKSVLSAGKHLPQATPLYYHLDKKNSLTTLSTHIFLKNSIKKCKNYTCLE